MLLLDIPRIPPEGLDLDEALEPAAVHLAGDPDLELLPGARLSAHVELVEGTNLHLRGRLSGSVATDCSRCLQRYPLTLGQELDLFYLPQIAGQQEAQEEEVELSDRDVVVGYYTGDCLDLGEVLREQILLALPLKPLCRDDCRGLCTRCGANRNTSPCGCVPEKEPGDLRLEPLRRLIDKKRQ